MTDDLVKRLRRGTVGDKERHAAADRIETLEAGEEDWNRICNRYAARIDKLEVALREIACSGSDWIKNYEIARKALEGKE